MLQVPGVDISESNSRIGQLEWSGDIVFGYGKVCRGRRTSIGGRLSPPRVSTKGRGRAAHRLQLEEPDPYMLQQPEALFLQWRQLRKEETGASVVGTLAT